MARYADVVLPLPVEGAFTYSLPSAPERAPRVGARVVVPFGSRKFYTGIVTRLHDDTPPRPTKELSEVVDEQPLVLPAQLRLWEWIADYYLCTLGEVYKAALPSGLKLESESRVRLDGEADGGEALTPSQRRIVDTLAGKKDMSLAELQRETGLRGVLPAVNALLARGLVTLREELRQKSKPPQTECVRLAEPHFSPEALEEARARLRRSPRQAEALEAYLRLSRAAEALARGDHSLLCEVERGALPREAVKALCGKGLLVAYGRATCRAVPGDTSPAAPLPALSGEQERARAAIVEAWATRQTCLLHGVTGSGKTEVYIRLMSEAVARGRQVLYLLPEIALTVQLTERLRRVFGRRLGVYHSRHTDAARVEVYRRMLSDTPYDIIVGARSSVFLPFQRLGLVVIDEEHETSYKQAEPAPRYHARNTALVLAAQTGAKVLLGTATPSLETYHNALSGKYGLVRLATRYTRVELPEIEVADTAEERRKKLMSGPFTRLLLRRVREALDGGRQAILFLNRRGYAPVVECGACGWAPRCQRCDVTLTLHRDARQMSCHYCGAGYAVPSVCPNCGEGGLHSLGYGTERVEDSLRALLPQARVARMDLDTTRSRASYERILHDFQRGATDVLIGTQMVAKGLDFERVGVVGILNADTMMSQPDFRSQERAFQMMEQVAGRAGRQKERGRVVLQTRDPEASVIGQVVRHDYEAMYREQAEEREAFGYPPYCRLVRVVVKHRDERAADRMAAEAAALLRQVFGERVLGPDTPAVARVQMMHIRQLLLKVENAASMAEARRRLRDIRGSLLREPAYKSAALYYDVD